MLPDDRYDGEFYPGSKTPVKDYARQKYGPPPETDILPPPFAEVDGQKFWTIGTLAVLLNRSRVTLRRWETSGDLPKTPWRRRNPEALTANGEVRLYTRAMIEGLVKIAYEEGLIAHRQRKLSTTRFKERAKALFKEVA